MGTNASPEIANLTLYWDEATYVDSLLLSDPRAAAKHAHTRRFIDDMLTWYATPPSSAHYGLEWRETTNNDGTCTFLGTKISIDNGSLRIAVFDKALEWSFKVIRYPSATSNAPAHQAAGVITGQLTRFMHICNRSADFKAAVKLLTIRMLQRGHPSPVLAKGWTSHVKGYQGKSPQMVTRFSQ